MRHLEDSRLHWRYFCLSSELLILEHAEKRLNFHNVWLLFVLPVVCIMVITQAGTISHWPLNVESLETLALGSSEFWFL